MAENNIKKEKQKSNRVRVSFYASSAFDKDIEEFSKRYKSKGKAIADMIKTNTDFKKFKEQKKSK